MRPVVASRWARLLFALIAVALALWLVRNQLRQISLGKVLVALRATRPSAIGLSILFTASSYACLAVVEWRGLMVLGRPQSFGRTAMASFASNALSTMMGFGMLSGTAVRLRAYAFAKLPAAEIARLVLVLSASTFASGIVVMGLGLLPAGGTPPAGWITPAVALVLIAPAGFWFIFFRSPGIGRHSPLTTLDRLGALAAALGDWVFSGAALFVLSSHDISALGSFMVVFCLGSLIASVVGVPGGLGVLDAVMLGLQAKNDIHETAAALVLYRLIYYVGPVLLTAAGAITAQCRRLLARLVAAFLHLGA